MFSSHRLHFYAVIIFALLILLTFNEYCYKFKIIKKRKINRFFFQFVISILTFVKYNLYKGMNDAIIYYQIGMHRI
jgi:hypothetical protein